MRLSATRPLSGGAPVPSSADPLAAADQQRRQRHDRRSARCLFRRQGLFEAHSIEGEASRHSQTLCAASHSVSRT